LKPYYDRDGITIWNADCAEVLPLIDPAEVALVLTDPPYGLGYDLLQRKWSQTDADHSEFVVGDQEPFDPAPLLRFGRCVIWGGNCFASRLPDHPGWLVWDKVTQEVSGMRGAEAEFAWTNFVTRSQVFRHLWRGAFRATENGFHVHPTQKPVSLMKWILGNWTEPGDLILDPYMGSGPVAQACHEMGRRYIGVEIVEEYCQVAVNRLAQGVLAFGE
jgi:DNA modification methylase